MGAELIKRFGRKVGEMEINMMQCFADNRTVQETADIMGLSKGGVQSRLLKLRIHFRVKTVAALVAIFFRENLIE